MAKRIPQGRTVSPLPALCARAALHPALQAELVRAAAAVSDWSLILRTAEQHSLSPLLYHHLTASGVTLPTPVKRELMGEFLQHTRANEIRASALVEMLAALEERGIRALVLKGAALAYTIYPQPGLRPMRDVDILVSPADLSQAREILLQLDYRDEPAGITPAGHHHLPPLARSQGGMNISVEIHHQIFPSTRHYRPLRYDDLIHSAFAFQIKDFTAYTLSLEDTLWHIYRHAAGPPLLTIPLKLIYVADITGLVEKYAAKIDWEKLQGTYPQILRVLPLLHFLTPWSPEVQARFNWDLSKPPIEVGAEFAGWPRCPFRAGTLADTFTPSEWWLRFFYGVGLGAPCAFYWHRWIRHPFHILEWAVSTGLAAWRKRS